MTCANTMPIERSPAPASFHTALRHLERMLLWDEGAVWARRISYGSPRDDVAWPADLPPPTPELAAWFAWSPEEHETSGIGWRSIERAAERYRELRDEPWFRATCVPALKGFVDTADGSYWIERYDDEGLSVLKRAAFSLTEAIEETARACAAAHAEKRGSPWPRLRIARADDAPWSSTAIPDVAWLDATPAGTALIMLPAQRARRTWLDVKREDGTWLHVRARTNVALGDGEIESLLQYVRWECASAMIEPQSAEVVLAQMRKTAGSAPGVVHIGALCLWEQPPMDDLLQRLDAWLRRSSRKRLGPPAAPADLRALEAVMESELPSDLRAFFLFAGAPGEDALYMKYRVADVSKAGDYIRTMLELGETQFGPAYWDRGLVPLLEAEDGDCIYVDVRGVHGPPGAIIDFDHNRPGERKVLFENVAQWLECFVDALENDLYVELDEDDGRLFPRELVEDGYTFALKRHDEVRTLGQYPWKLRVPIEDR
ncbi:Hypothetical protein A7982_04285 [Minicystis rosea]|nr:Hypothetical protein A7982_04285 [Minicystis rosea]